MPNRYAACDQATGGTGKCLLNISGGATVRTAISHLLLSVSGVPADVAGLFSLLRTTTQGTGDALSETALDPISVAASAAATGNHSAAPTETANSELLHFALNQRATFTWWAREGFELLNVLTAANGIDLSNVSMSSSTPNLVGTIHWFE